VGRVLGMFRFSTKSTIKVYADKTCLKKGLNSYKEIHKANQLVAKGFS
jgi:hypothetical protein